MYIVASQWKFGDVQVARTCLDLFQSDLRQFVATQPGLCFWYLVGTGTGEALTITGWHEQQQYETAAPILAAWLQERLAGLDARILQRRRGAVLSSALPS